MVTSSDIIYCDKGIFCLFFFTQQTCLLEPRIFFQQFLAIQFLFSFLLYQKKSIQIGSFFNEFVKAEQTRQDLT